MPACSTGEEAYSLAIVFKEALEQFQPARSHALQIFATDLDKDAIEKARTAVFPANIAADVSPERLARHIAVAAALEAAGELPAGTAANARSAAGHPVWGVPRIDAPDVYDSKTERLYAAELG